MIITFHILCNVKDFHNTANPYNQYILQCYDDINSKKAKKIGNSKKSISMQIAEYHLMAASYWKLVSGNQFIYLAECEALISRSEL